MLSVDQTRPNETKPQIIGLVCHACGSNLIHRSHHSNSFERILLRLVGARPFRCESCEHRFYSRWKASREITECK